MAIVIVTCLISGNHAVLPSQTETQEREWSKAKPKAKVLSQGRGQCNVVYVSSRAYKNGAVCVSVCVSVCLLVSTVTAKQIDVRSYNHLIMMSQE